MENLAYLHIAFAYEECPSSELVSLSCLLQRAASPNWQRFSSKAWTCLLPLVLTLSILNSVESALALQRGDQGPSVRSLQQSLRRAGFYQAPITQVYDTRTEDAVRRFQQAAGLKTSGIAETDTLKKLQNWQTTKPSTVSSQTQKRSSQSSRSNKPVVVSANSLNTNNRRSPNLLQKGDEGEAVVALQERLRVAGFYYGNATGIFGPITEEAVKRFQQAYQLDVDGVVGPETFKKLPPVGVGYGEDIQERNRSRDTLRLGDRGEAVRVLQEHLIQAGYLEGEPNGVFGPYTADAVRRFQANHYLAASGIAGPTTRGKLYSMVTTAPRSNFDVLEIQRRLLERGFYKGSLNGVLGDDTKKAIRQAQEFYGISLSDVRSGQF